MHVWISVCGSRSLDYPQIIHEILGCHGTSSNEQDKDSFTNNLYVLKIYGAN